MLHKKSILALALITAPLFVQAAVTQGQLTFTWQATVPATDVLSGAWKFTDPTGGDYTPSVIALQASINDDRSLDLVTQTPATFEIRSVSASNLNSVSAYLASVPSGTGITKPLTLKTTLAAPGEDEVIVVLNDQALNSGSNNAITIQNNVNNTATSMSLALYAKVATDNYTPGGSISFTTPVIFSVNVADSISS
ncbi:fimbrial protein [Edwardsiella piscicida]|uniref:fimbrial protein n=1 Tax=Edwardsiella piscicida TaxID=1263550 RepID=UPI00247B2694|nr:fimbrial protein [Edwardsiella piscicida]ELM3735972.1 fimbrial protein [Edwardsiella piscicida]WGS76103.1 fimbrial protein [Edwardsiella piscicida]WGS79493.1 fimbrial protein [Edwardsiella piscicida]